MRDYFPKNLFETLARNRDHFCLSKGISCTTSIKDAIGDLEQANGSMPSPDTKGFMAGIYGPEQSG